MSVITKVLSTLMMKTGIASSAPIFHRLLLNVMAVVALTVVLGIMVGALLCVILFITYSALLSYGYSPIAAGVITSGIFLAIVGLLVHRLFCFRCTIKRNLYEAVSIQTPVVGKASDILQAFINGLLKK